MENRNYFHISDEIKIQAIRNIASDIQRILGGIILTNTHASDEDCIAQYEDILRLNKKKSLIQDVYRTLLTDEVDHIFLLRERSKKSLLSLVPRR